MLHFLHVVHASMTSSRRKLPIPQDFIAALALHSLTPSSLTPFLSPAYTPHAASVTQPALPLSTDLEPASTIVSTAALDPILGPALSSAPLRATRRFVPSHLPAWPSRHTWQSTAVFARRPDDDLDAAGSGKEGDEGREKMKSVRERATEEAVMAEQALRRLMSGSKSRAAKREEEERKRRVESGDGEVGDGRRRNREEDDRRRRERKVQDSWDAVWKAAQRMDEEEREREEKERQAEMEMGEVEMEDDMLMMMEMEAPMGAKKAKVLLNAPFESDMLVNHDRRFWRESGSRLT